MPVSDSIDASHPSYDARLRQWERCRDCWDGQDKVKARDGGARYLPPTQGQLIDGAFGSGGYTFSTTGNTTYLVAAGAKDNIGQQNYNAYLNRALFYGFYADAVQMALGLAWTKEPIFEGLEDTPLEYLLEKATNEGESLCRLLYRINESQLGIGRIGLLADMPAGETNGKPQPYITTYECESIINWDAGRVGEMNQETLNLVVLDECAPMRTGMFEWDTVERYRVLALGALETNEEVGVYRQGLFENISTAGSSGTPAFDESYMIAPSINGRVLDEIPFVFVNSSSATSDPVDPPLLSLADLAISLYQISADYHQELHASTQATLVIKGQKPRPPTEKEVRLGAGALIELADTATSDASFLEISGKGLPALEKAVADLKALCQQRAGEIVDQSSRGRESGNALEQRISVRTASLHAIVQSGAAGLERLLRIMGKWLGMSEDQIKLIRVKPNYVFSKPSLSAIELKSLMESKALGAMISIESVHQYLVNRGFTTLSFAEMKAQWESEKPLDKELRPPIDPTKGGGANGGPKVLPASTGF